MRIFQCATLLALLAAASSQYLHGGGFLPPRKYMSDSALHKFLSAIRGGGRGHRELMSLTGSASSPQNYASIQPGPRGPAHFPAFGIGIGQLPPSVTHVSAPPKIGAFYITPPERNAPSFYGPPQGRQPQLVKLTDLKNARPFNLITAETQNRPRGPPPQQQQPHHPQGLPPGIQLYQVNGPTPGAPNGLPIQHQHLAGIPGGFLPIQQNVVQTGPSGQGASQTQSLEEIIAKAAQKQHAMVLEKEQKAHPNAQITNSQILVPGAGQQPVFINQFGQPFLAPAIFGPGGPHPQQLNGPPPHPQHLPPHLLATNGQGQIVMIHGPPPPQLLRQPQQQQQGRPQNLNSINGEIPEQLLKAQQSSPQQQQLQLGGFQIPQGQILVQGGPQGGQGPPRGIPIQFGPSGPQFPGGPGQILNLPPGVVPGNFAIPAGGQGQFIPGNAILGQPHIAFLGNPQQFGQQLQQQQQQLEQQQGKAEKEEQPARPQEAASQKVESTVSAPSPGTIPLSQGHGHMTAAIMQSQVEFSEPIVKM